MSVLGIITNIQRCSTEDGPGIRTTVFMKGCPLHCIWCHNIETIDSKPRLIWHGNKCIGDRACIAACPEDALDLTSKGMHINLGKCKTCGDCEDECPSGALEIMGTQRESLELIEDLLRDKIFFDTSKGGVTISGGEPLQQAEFTMEIAKGLRECGVHVALDTTAYANEIVFQRVIEHVDLVLLDLKNMDPVKHQDFTGVPLERITSNSKLISEMNIPIWVRTPIIPNHTDSEDNIREISRFIKTNLPTTERYDLLAFNKMCTEKYALFGLDYPLKDLPLIPEEIMIKLASIAEEEGVANVVWSGMTRHQHTTNNA